MEGSVWLNGLPWCVMAHLLEWRMSQLKVVHSTAVHASKA